MFNKLDILIHIFFCKGTVNTLTLTTGSDLNGVGVSTPHFTLTCISTGGPATTVTWTRDSETILDDNTFSLTTELNNAVIAQYTHTLTITGRLGGLYTCTVANERPSQAVMELFIHGKVHPLVESY